jgi:hypothetical protein
MQIRFPLYDKTKSAPLLAEVCEVCGARLDRTSVVIVLSTGAVVDDINCDNTNDIDDKQIRFLDDRMLGHFSVDYHEIFADLVRGQSDLFTGVNIVEDAKGGQFDLGFCSVPCLRAFFDEILRQVEARVGESKANRARGLPEAGGP